MSLWSDGEIAVGVRDGLARDCTVAHGRVRLDGGVDSESQRDETGSILRARTGVPDVVNRLHIAGTPSLVG